MSALQVSILAGTLARLDRDAPHYKKYVFIVSKVIYFICMLFTVTEDLGQLMRWNLLS